MILNAVYVVDGDADVRASLAYFLASAGFVEQTFADPRNFLSAAENLVPGCVLLDVRMPGIDGLEVLERLAGQARLPVVVMTGHGDVVTAVRAMKLGAVDFLEKPFAEGVLLDVLARTFGLLGGTVRDLDRRCDARARLAALTDRGREVLVALLSGRANKVIAFELGLSVRTVEMHRAAMMDRLGVRSFAEALRLALDGGIEIAAARTPAELAQ